MSDAAAFDSLARRYDAQFTDRLLGRLLRGNVQARLEPLLAPGMRALEIGCGTGEDALWLARRNLIVTATDAAPAMLEVAFDKARAAGQGDAISFRRLDAAAPHAADDEALNGPFDFVLSNFGVLNCITDLEPLANWLAPRMAPEGVFAAVVMGPFCLWETLTNLLRGRGGEAFRRFSKAPRAQVDDVAIDVRYPAPDRFLADFVRHFGHVETAAVGALLPPSNLAGLVEGWPRTFQRLARWERTVATWPPFVMIGDHYLIILERSTAEDG